jgi:hypothetical protein
MAGFVKDAGTWKEIKEVHVKSGGSWFAAKSVHRKSGGSWVEIFKAAVEAVISATTTDVDISALFSPTDWSSDKDKIVTIPSGVIVGATSTGMAALRTGTGMGGVLIINIDGEVQGKGGAAAAAGGPAINVQGAGVTINNAGAIRAGGGGGGAGGTGGTGGGGSFGTTNQQGPFYSYPGGYHYNASTFLAYWNGANVTWNLPRTAGGYTYYQSGGPIFEDGGANITYAIYRTWVTTTYTSGGAGGAGGAGGVGQGYAQANTGGAAGSGGAAGGTNAGAGGTGGTGGAGGTWGAAGATGDTGATGNSGNYTGGLAGAGGGAGGAAGAAIIGTSPTVNNSGTINGAVA